VLKFHFVPFENNVIGETRSSNATMNTTVLRCDAVQPGETLSSWISTKSDIFKALILHARHTM